jgi:hypothetical protein
MEKAGLHKSCFPDVQVNPGSEQAAFLVASGTNNDPSIPKLGDNVEDQRHTYCVVATG